MLTGRHYPDEPTSKSPERRSINNRQGEKLYLVSRYTMDYTRLTPAFIYVPVKPTDLKVELL